MCGTAGDGGGPIASYSTSPVCSTLAYSSCGFARVPTYVPRGVLLLDSSHTFPRLNLVVQVRTGEILLTISYNRRVCCSQKCFDGCFVLLRDISSHVLVVYTPRVTYASPVNFCNKSQKSKNSFE